MEKKLTRCKKKPWVPPEIFRVKLNPEQAVLSCCEEISKGWYCSDYETQCGDGSWTSSGFSSSS